MKLIIYNLLLLLVISSNSFSQGTYVPKFGDPINEPWRWTKFDELSGKGVECISESSDGNIWFGVKKGLIRFNGLEWKEYSSKNGFIDNTVYHLTNSVDQLTYAGTNVGLYTYNNVQWEKIFPMQYHPKNEWLQKINCLKTLNNGGIIASVGNDIYRGVIIIYNKKTTLFASQKTIDSLGQTEGIEMQVVPEDRCIEGVFHVEEIFQDNKNRIWIWASFRSNIGHVFYIDIDDSSSQKTKYSKNFTSEDGLIKGDRIKFGQDNQGNIWTVCNDLNIGINIYNGVSWKYQKLKGENAHRTISNINGDIWIGGFSVLYTFKNGRWNKYQRPLAAIPGGHITIFNDSKGYLWIIGTQNEVSRVDCSSSRWTSYYYLNFQCEDNANNLWFLSVDGKVIVNKENEWLYYHVDDGLPDAPVKIYCTRKGLLCVAGSYKEQACISFLRNQQWVRQVYEEFSWGIDYRAIFEDNEENLWIGASVNYNNDQNQKGGVIKLQNPGTNNQKKIHYLPEKRILRQTYGISQSKDGRIWIAGSHLNYFENYQWHQFTDIKELTQYTNCLGNTADGDLWIGSRMSGVYWYNNNSWTNFNTDDGLKSNTIISICPVNNNDIWIATNRDFSHFDGKGWTTDILPETFTLNREGGDILVQKDGTLWINHSTRDWKRRALNNNVIEKVDIDYFATFSYKKDTVKPETKIELYSSEVPSTGNILIEWSGTEAWQSSQNAKLQFSYRLNGNEWSEYSYKDNITFFNLKNGHYTFEVKARDMGFNEDASPAKVNFIVLPPVWKQTWFILLILFFLSIIIIYQYNAIRRNKNLERLNIQLANHSEEIERKNILLEEQKDQILQQNLLEKESNLKKIRFFTNISHEFRTPLTLISGIIDILTQKTVNNIPSEFNNQLNTVKRNTNRLLRLINQLMDFRKMENDSIALKVSNSDIVRFIKDICFSFKEFAKKHQIDLHFMSQFQSLDGWFDPDKLEKILYNLISNAIKFTTEGGSISIKLESVMNNKTESAVITVDDTGIGIAENEIKKIFEPFYQIESAGKYKYEGTGIGLSLVNNFVNLHHGTMEVKSTTSIESQSKNKFSTRFIITIPIDKNEYTKHELAQYQNTEPVLNSICEGELSDLVVPQVSFKELGLPNNRNIPLVIVVEDNEDLRRFMINSLNNYYNVLSASNGIEGFDLVVKHMPDIIISDIMMPEMSGTELCNKLKNDIRTSHIPVILLTARTTDENKMEGFQIGADDYISKPFNMSLLIARIKNILAIRISLRRKYSNEEFTQPDEVQVSSIDKVFLQKVKTVVENNFANHLFGVKELSNEVGISRRHLLFKLQNLIDMTPTEYIKNFRLTRAAQFLVSRKASISEISDEVGFNDISYFSSCFTRQYGMNPSTYIKTYYNKKNISS